MASRTPASTPPPRRSDTAPDQHTVAESHLPLPHERDEASGMTGGVQSKPVQQAHRDVERGLKDTSKSPEMDRTYRQLKDKAPK